MTCFMRCCSSSEKIIPSLISFRPSTMLSIGKLLSLCFTKDYRREHSASAGAKHQAQGDTSATQEWVFAEEENAVPLQQGFKKLKTFQKNWFRLMKKVAVYLELLKKHNYAMQVLGQSAYEGIFTPMLLEDWQVHSDKWQAEKNRRPFTRLINTKKGWMVVADRLEDGQGKQDLSRKTQDPSMCTHPEDSMMMRGAKLEKDNHWLCKDCCARWSRRPLANYRMAYSTEPDHKNLVTFGKYTGMTYQKAYEDQQFVQFAIDRVEMEDYPPPYIHLFVRYCKLRRGQGGCSASSDVWRNGSQTTSTDRARAKPKAPKAKPTAKPKESHSIHSSPTHSDVEMVSGVTHYIYGEEDL